MTGGADSGGFLCIVSMSFDFIWLKWPMANQKPYCT